MQAEAPGGLLRMCVGLRGHRPRQHSPGVVAGPVSAGHGVGTCQAGMAAGASSGPQGSENGSFWGTPAWPQAQSSLRLGETLSFTGARVAWDAGWVRTGAGPARPRPPPRLAAGGCARRRRSGQTRAGVALAPRPWLHWPPHPPRGPSALLPPPGRPPGPPRPPPPASAAPWLLAGPAERPAAGPPPGSSSGSRPPAS